MTSYAALLRAVNVGGTGKLAMADLRRLCEGCGFADVATYIQSGNVVFRSKLGEAAVHKKLAAKVSEVVGKPVAVLVRTAAELAAVLQVNPFPKAPPNRVLVFFLPEAPPRGALDRVAAPGREELALRGRELFIHFPDGQGKSKLKVPFGDVGTGRNLNTVGKLAAMAAALA